jgi:hypothetical protein
LRFCAQCGSPQPGPTRWRPTDEATDTDPDAEPIASDDEWLTTPQTVAAHRDHPPGVPPRTSRPRRVAILVAAALVVVGGVMIAAAFSRPPGSPADDPLVIAPFAVPSSLPAAAQSTASTPRGTPSPPPRSRPSPTRPPAVPPKSPAPPTSVGIVDVRAVTADPHVLAVGTLFDRYFSGINTKQYEQVLVLFDPSGFLDPTDPAQVEAFTTGVSTTTDSLVVLRSMAEDAAQEGDLDARLTFQSHQAAGFGPPGSPEEICTNWDITYQLRPAGAGYRIFSPRNVVHTPC